LCSREWIVPRQEIGPTGYFLAKKISKKGKLHFYPRVKIKLSEIELRNCVGKSRNNSGISMIIKSRVRSNKINLLLPGDTEYRCLSNTERIKYNVLIATHHGGRLGPFKFIPNPRNDSLVVYSYGENNSFGHPKQKIKIAYEKNGWSINEETVRQDVFIPLGCKPGKVLLWKILHHFENIKIVDFGKAFGDAH
jgi:hypothetical protein